MRSRRFVLFACLIASFVAGRATAIPHAQADAQLAAMPTRVDEDSQANVIRFFIGGKEQAILDSEGLHINGSVDYTGAITDGNRYSQPPAKPQGGAR